MQGKITIKNKSGPVATIDIEGTIGVPEEWQFDEPASRIATYEKFRAVVDSLREVESPEVVVNIRSTGGNVNDALLIYDTLAVLGECGVRITTRCYGYIASAATIIAQAASTGCREVSANSLYLVHRSVCATEGNAAEIAKTLGMLEKTDQRIAAIYAARSGRSVEDFAALMSDNDGNGRWLSPEETVEIGLADRIVASSKIPADAAQVVMNLGLPPIPVNFNQEKSMNTISKRWTAILEVLGLASYSASAASTQQAPIVGSAAVEQVALAEATIDSMAAAQVEMSNAHKEEVTRLRNRIDILEAANARLAVHATATMPKEDPSAQEISRTPNEDAYIADIRQFV